MAYKTTSKDFTEFKKYCKEYIQFFGLKGWYPFYEHSLDPMGIQGCRSAIKASIDSRAAEIALNKDFDCEPTSKELKEVAKHEILHLLLWTLVEYSEDPRVSRDVVFAEEHSVIRILETLIK